MIAYVVVCSDPDRIHTVEAFQERAKAEDYKVREATTTYTDIIREFGEDSECGIEVKRGYARVTQGDDTEWRWTVHKIEV